jgi:tyrosinase
MAGVRKNQARLSSGEWDSLISAMDAIRATGAAPPRYRDFVQVHVDAMTGPQMHQWAVHTMGPMRGRNFLAWHRQFLLRFEERLQQEDPDITIPYWNWATDPNIPSRLNRRSLLQRWGVTRRWDRSWMPDRADVRAALRREKFGPFQSRLEFVHGDVHNAVGGEMATERSPADPLFWLHHSNVDRLWAQWQGKHPGTRPRNSDERLQPPPLFGVRVREVLRISSLGYSYR